MSPRGGKLEITPTLLGTVIATCLAIGSGGAFYVNRSEAAPGESAKVEARMAVLEERSRSNDIQLSEIKQSLRDISQSVKDLDKKFDRRLPR